MLALMSSQPLQYFYRSMIANFRPLTFLSFIWLLGKCPFFMVQFCTWDVCTGMRKIIIYQCVHEEKHCKIDFAQLQMIQNNLTNFTVIFLQKTEVLFFYIISIWLLSIFMMSDEKTKKQIISFAQMSF